jgi:hypothetical protein
MFACYARTSLPMQIDRLPVESNGVRVEGV